MAVESTDKAIEQAYQKYTKFRDAHQAVTSELAEAREKPYLTRLLSCFTGPNLSKQAHTLEVAATLTKSQLDHLIGGRAGLYRVAAVNFYFNPEYTAHVVGVEIHHLINDVDYIAECRSSFIQVIERHATILPEGLQPPALRIPHGDHPTLYLPTHYPVYWQNWYDDANQDNPTPRFLKLSSSPRLFDESCFA